MLMSLSALKVSAVLAPHVIPALTLILPACVPAPAVVTVILLDARAVFNVAALITVSFWLATKPTPVPVALEITTLYGSINQFPVLPLSESVETLMSLSILTFAALVSIKPPSAPFLPSAFNIPLTWVSPVCISPNKMISPLAFCVTRLASIIPL